MWKLVTGLVAFVFAQFATAAIAQDVSPISTHFQQYIAALDRGDLVTAEAEASAALAASEQRDGGGGRTPILAFNLARTRVALGQWEQASAPAQRAYELSRRVNASGVDPLLSGLLLGRVRLSLEGFRATGFLSGLLDRSNDREDLLADRYDAAEQLGLWAMQTNNHLISRNAWRHAAEAARGAPFDAGFARGRARAYEAIAIALKSFTRDVFMSATDAREAREGLAEAYALVQPFAFTAGADDQVTAPQQLYAEILAWDAAVWSKVTTDDPARSRDARLSANPNSIDGVPFCAIRRSDGDNLTYPAQQAREGQLGAVVVRLRFSDQGAYQGASVAASVGDEDLQHNVAAAAATWTYSIDSLEGCKPAAILYVPIVFAMRE